MCGRFSLRKSPHEVRSILGVTSIPISTNETPRVGDPDRPRYNIAPTQDVLGIRQGTVGREAAWFRWGLVPPGAKTLKLGAKLINARAETVFKTAAFARAVRTQRCLIAADGFIEWKKIGQRRHPFHIRRTDGEVFAMAGVWQRWSHEGRTTETCSVLTTSPNALVAPLHNRMPVILQTDVYDAWLDPTNQATETLQPLLVPLPAEMMIAEPINPRVNDVAHDDPACLERIEPPEPPAEQLGFRFES